MVGTTRTRRTSKFSECDRSAEQVNHKTEQAEDGSGDASANVNTWPYSPMTSIGEKIKLDALIGDEVLTKLDLW
jgi:hypothetical protein